ncbi:hypothetical protein CAP36_04485 [Chitinophagaceae bacterium IBVUCB2]|nr:hypothetical protein CAP36_04485 [Chitinophagaceae bacterium IBVUCB2]
MYQNLLIATLLFISSAATAQSIKLYGKITNAKMEPLAFVSVQVKEYKQGSVTKEDGSYELELEEGKYDLIVTMVGYKAQVLTIIIRKTNIRQDIILEASDATNLSEVTIKGKFKDKAEEYIRNVIRNKDAIEAAAGPYSCNVYIKALQEDSMEIKKPKKTAKNDSMLKANQGNAEMNRMAFAEIVLRLDKESSRRIKEERTGVSKRGNSNNLFFLSTTEADFNFYNNIVNIPTISQTPFLSPLSYSGLLAYRFKTLKTETINGKKVYTISIKPRQLSNATVEGEITIADGTWVVLHTKLQLPKYHLAEYDFFEVEQQYELVNGKAWMITRQELTYKAMSDKKKSSGRTVVTYKDFELNKAFDKKYFGTELSSASSDAYKRDSSFWEANRTEPLTEKEVRFIHYKDSVYQATHTKTYLDSLDRITNKITWQKILFKGQQFNDHEKRRHWNLPALYTLYQPFSFGGTRLQAFVGYSKTFESRKNIFINGDLSYGFRNKDINGAVHINRLYNPFNRGYYYVSLEKSFEAIFSGDAWINMIKRSNVYLHQAVGLGHSIELANGLFLFSNADVAFRKSVSDYKTNSRVDSLFDDLLDDNQAPAFPSYNAFYGKLRVEYTPGQRYIREPKEKVILGSAWPTFYVQWRKGIPGLMNSVIDFDYLEFGIRQSAKLGVTGTSSYSVKTGSFLNQKELRLVDYKYQRRGDPIFFMNPSEAFQSLDSSFATFKRFYEGHYIHEFNGALLNKIPFFKKIGLREIAGAGFLFAPERNLRYAEVFTGIERVFKIPFNNLGKFKLGVYVVGSAANQFRNPVQFKIGITTWDRKKGKWF